MTFALGFVIGIAVGIGIAAVGVLWWVDVNYPLPNNVED